MGLCVGGRGGSEGLEMVPCWLFGLTCKTINAVVTACHSAMSMSTHCLGVEMPLLVRQIHGRLPYMPLAATVHWNDS